MEILLTLTALALLYFFVRTVLLSKENEELKVIALESYGKKYSGEVDKEGFIKFISDSRDWAFEYIEEVQNGLEKFINHAGPHIEYFDEYGDVISTPLNPAMQEISKAYKDLKKLLPEEPDAKNKI